LLGGGDLEVYLVVFRPSFGGDD